jgi:hypothetical protein
MRRLLMLSVALAAMVAPMSVVASEHEGSVQARVYVEQPAPCITLDGALADFGVAQFSTTSSANYVQGAMSTITNCSGGSADLLARTTKASNAAGTVQWTPVNTTTNPCATGPNTFQHVLFLGVGGFAIDETNQTVLVSGDTFGDGQQRNFQHLLGMPCTGSDGNNDALTWTVTFTAVMP